MLKTKYVILLKDSDGTPKPAEDLWDDPTEADAYYAKNQDYIGAFLVSVKVPPTPVHPYDLSVWIAEADPSTVKFSSKDRGDHTNIVIDGVEYEPTVDVFPTTEAGKRMMVKSRITWHNVIDRIWRDPKLAQPYHANYDGKCLPNIDIRRAS